MLWRSSDGDTRYAPPMQDVCHGSRHQQASKRPYADCSEVCPIHVQTSTWWEDAVEEEQSSNWRR